ncbi:MAG: hypothetical protein FJ106_12695, partial [Deltaproteobacteria bacterium]|nr:hypothetical protein [Deltaproteobacteria bacterium]
MKTLFYSNRTITNLPGAHLLLGDAQDVKDIFKAGLAKAHIGGSIESSLGIVGNSQTGLTQHQY